MSFWNRKPKIEKTITLYYIACSDGSRFWTNDSVLHEAGQGAPMVSCGFLGPEYAAKGFLGVEPEAKYIKERRVRRSHVVWSEIHEVAVMIDE